MSVQLTTCCKAPVYTKHEQEEVEHGYYIGTFAPACNGCHEEHPETFEACECCGEREGTIPTELGDWCEQCVAEEAKAG